MSADISGCHNWGGGRTTGIYWAEARDAAQHPTMHRAVPTTELSGPKRLLRKPALYPDPSSRPFLVKSAILLFGGSAVSHLSLPTVARAP